MISNRIKLISTLLFLCLSLSLKAQTPDIIEQKMNEIKRNGDMIYGEGYGSNRDIAYRNALSDLLMFANERRMNKGLGMIEAADLQAIAKELTYSLKKRHVVMVYVSGSQVFSLTNQSQVDVVSPIPDNNSQSNVAETEDVADPKPDPDITSDTNYPNSNVVSTASESIGSSVPPLPDDVLKTLCSQDNWIEIKGFMSTYKNQGKIKETHACRSSDEVPDDAYSILIDDRGSILSILSPKNTSNRINYRTNYPDSESNYPNCKFIVWYK